MSDRFPRRRRAARPHPGPLSRAEDASSLFELGGGETASEALDVARYVADMAAQLEAMSEAADLDLLAYFLNMAKAEAETFLWRADSAKDEPPPLPGSAEGDGSGMGRGD